MTLERKILSKVLRHVMIGFILPYVRTKTTRFVMLSMIALPAAGLDEYANKEGRCPYLIAFVEALRTRPILILWVSSLTFSTLGWLSPKRVGQIPPYPELSRFGWLNLRWITRMFSMDKENRSRFGGFNTSRPHS